MTQEDPSVALEAEKKRKEAELDKVNSLMSMAQSKMGQVEDREATPEEENMFAMASLMQVKEES